MPIFYFSKGRSALYWGLIALGCDAKSHVLMPDFICDDILQPFRKVGMTVATYEVTDQLEPKWHDVMRHDMPKGGLFLLVHYFGQPSNIRIAENICREKNWALVEDNAHGYGARYDGQFLGTFGEMGITSPHKSFWSPYGGLLYLNNEVSSSFVNSYKILERERVKIVHWLLRQVLKRFRLLRAIVNSMRKMPAYDNPRAFRNLDEDFSLRIDVHSEALLSSKTISSLTKARHHSYESWHKFALLRGLRPVFSELKDGAMPWCFPAYASSREERNKWIEWGWKHGHHVYSWPTLPENFLREGSEPLKKWCHLICFGINPLDNSELK